MDSSDLGLESGVDETVSGKHGLALELRRDNYGLECLATATYTKTKHISKIDGWNKRQCLDVIASFFKVGFRTRQILNLDMQRLQRLGQLVL